MPGPDDERIDIYAVLHDMTSPEAENINRKIDDIGDSSEKSSKQVEDLGKQTDKSGRSWRRYTLDLRSTRREHRNADKSIEGTRRRVKGLGDEVERSSKKIVSANNRSGGSFKKLWSWIKKGFGLFKIVGLFSAIADAIGFIGTALKGLGAASYAGIAGLSPLVGLLGTLPGMYASLGQGLGVVKLATAGIGEAISVMGDPAATVEEYEKATKNLSKNQIQFAQSVATSKDEWIELRKEVGDRFFKNVGPLYLRMTQKYQPLLNKQLGISADHWNVLIHSVGDYLSSKDGLRVIGSIMENNNRIFEKGTPGINNGFQLLLRTIDAAGPALNDMTGDFTRMMTKGNNWAMNNEQEFADFFSNSYNLAERVGNALGDMFVGLYNIGKLSAPLSRYMGKSSEDALEQFRLWTESKEGRESIRTFFKDMKPVVRELAKWVGSLVDFGADVSLDPDTFVKWSHGLRTEALPMIADIIQKLQGWVTPLFIRASETYNNLNESGITGGVGRSLKFFASGIEKVAEVAADLPSVTKDLIGFATGVWAGYKILNRGAIGRGISALTGGKLGNNGIQKVWVMNPGFGGGRGGAVPGGVVGGAGGTGAAGRHKGLGRWGRVKGAVGRNFRGFGAGSLGLGIAGSVLASSKNDGAQLLGNAGMGASVGSSFGPVGTGIGAAAGTLWSMRSMAKQTAADRANNWKNPSWLLDNYNSELAEQQKWKSQMWMGQNPSTGESEWKFPTNASGQQLYSEDQLEASQASLRKMAETFEKLTGKNLTEYRSALDDLPKDVQTDITTPGLEWSNKMIEKLLGRYDMTPKEKQTALKLLGAEEALTNMRNLKNTIDAIRDKTVRINIERTGSLVATGSGGIGKGEDAFAPRFKGGSTYVGKMYLAGEAGPEAWVGKNGQMKMLGMNGPEFVKPGTGAVVNTSTTRDPFGSTDRADSPEWAVRALQKATGAMARQSSRSSSTATAARLPDVKVTVVNPSTGIDIERAVERAIKKILKDEEERS